MDGGGDGWSEAVEDLVDGGDVEGAISVLESVVAKLETSSTPSNDLRLASALGDLADLADLHSSRGFSLKADELRSRALALRAHPRSGEYKPAKEKEPPKEEIRVSSPSNNQYEDEDDWEAIVDRGAPGDVLLSLRNEAASSPSRDDPEPIVAPKRRGRGSFLYKKSYMHSDQLDIETALENDAALENATEARGVDSTGTGNSRFGTSHILVLYDFPPSTRTVDLEKHFEKFKDRGVAIRWVNDTVALAVFRTPAIAHEAQRNLNCPFKIRSLSEDDNLLTQLTTRDLEPPYPRLKTSARTAERLIAQGMGIKAPSTTFGSNELRKQERIVYMLVKPCVMTHGGSDKPLCSLLYIQPHMHHPSAFTPLPHICHFDGVLK